MPSILHRSSKKLLKSNPFVTARHIWKIVENMSLKNKYLRELKEYSEPTVILKKLLKLEYKKKKDSSNVTTPT